MDVGRKRLSDALSAERAEKAEDGALWAEAAL